MLTVKECVSCGSHRLWHYDAYAAPFIAKRVWNKDSMPAQMMRCKDCGMVFFNPRFSDEEMNTLYTDYRGETYQKQREMVEPAYTAECNAKLTSESDYHDMKRKTITDFLTKRIDLAKVRTVLDFGGDKGQSFGPEFAGKDLNVYDISGVETVEGVHRYDLAHKRKFDLVLCCHVLEHLPFPRNDLKMIRECGDSSTQFYFEVPWEYPLLSRETGMRGRFENFMYNTPALFNPYRKLNGNKFMMHEHINYFNETSLANLLMHNGFEVKATEKIRVVGKTIDTQVISCLASLKPN